MNMLTIKKLGIYLRVSTEDQADDDRYSIPIQREQGKAFAEKEGVDYEIFEDHKSGGSIDRAGWQALFEQVEAGMIDGIWIAKFDRFSRDTADGMTAIKTMRKTSCRLWVNSLEYDIHDPNTEFQITMYFAFATYERAQIKARTMAGKKKLRDEGNRIVVDMLGWDRYIDKEGKKSVKQNEDEVKIVRFIFAEFLSGTNIPDIGRKLVNAGYKGKYSGKTYRYPNGEEKTIEDRWTYSTIKQVLEHPEYAALTYDSARVKLIPSKKYLPPIVSKEDWEKVQLLLKLKRATYEPKTGYRIVTHFASGFLSCEKCGAKYYYLNYKGGRRTKNYFYYVHKKLTPEQRSCVNTATMLPVELVENFLSDVYLSLFRSPWSIEVIFEKETKAIAKDEVELTKDEARITKALEENQRKTANFLKAIAAGIDLEGIKSEVNKLKSEKIKLETELSKRRREFQMKYSDMESVLDQFTEESLDKFMTGTGESKRAMLRKVTKKAIVSDEGGKKNILVITIDGRRHWLNAGSQKEFKSPSTEAVIDSRKGFERLRELQRAGKVEWKKKQYDVED